MARKYRARPRLPSAYPARIGVPMTDSMFGEIIALADAWKLPAAAAVRRIIDEWLEAEKKRA